MGESYQNVKKTILFKFFQTFFYVIWDYKTSGDFRKKKLRAGRSAGRPQSGYFLAQLVCFEFRVSKHFLFCHIWDDKTSRDIRNKIEG
jgi:hypothetical protein